jgi:hypothetical protein
LQVEELQAIFSLHSLLRDYGSRHIQQIRLFFLGHHLGWRQDLFQALASALS